MIGGVCRGILTCSNIHLLTILNELFYPDLCKARRITYWMEALMENCPQIFKSFNPEERMTILQEA